MDGCHKIIVPMEKSHKIVKLATATKKGKKFRKLQIQPLYITGWLLD